MSDWGEDVASRMEVLGQTAGLALITYLRMYEGTFGFY